MLDSWHHEGEIETTDVVHSAVTLSLTCSTVVWTASASSSVRIGVHDIIIMSNMELGSLSTTKGEVTQK